METILGILLGAVLGGAGRIFFDYYQRIQEKRAIAAAIAGEISAVLNNARVKQLPTYFQNLSQQLKSSTPPPPPWAIYDASFKEEPVLDAYIGRLGALGPKLVQRVSHWYSTRAAVRLEVKVLAAGLYDKNPQQAAARIDSGLALWQVVETDGEALIADLMALSGEQP